jgi:hypothetical protein
MKSSATTHRAALSEVFILRQNGRAKDPCSCRGNPALVGAQPAAPQLGNLSAAPANRFFFALYCAPLHQTPLAKRPFEALVIRPSLRTNQSRVSRNSIVSSTNSSNGRLLGVLGVFAPSTSFAITT